MVERLWPLLVLLVVGTLIELFILHKRKKVQEEKQFILQVEVGGRLTHFFKVRATNLLDAHQKVESSLGSLKGSRGSDPLLTKFVIRGTENLFIEAFGTIGQLEKALAPFELKEVPTMA